MAKIKICGLSRMCDIEAVNDASPDYIGFVFAESKRRVTPDEAYELRKALAPGITPVGVFVNEPPENIVKIIKCGIIDIIQLHGSESEDYISQLKSLTGTKIIKAVPVLKAGDAQKYAQSPADYLLLDYKTGGSGKSFDWELTGDVTKPYFLAGGININNVEEALKKTSPFAVDISSGVETGGVKDPEKIRAIVNKIRGKE